MKKQRDVMKDRMKELYSDQKSMEKQRYRMIEHYVDPKNREKHKNDMK